MAANMLRAIASLGRAGELISNYPRRNKAFDDSPGRFRPFFVVERILPGRHLTPARSAATRYFDNDDVAGVSPAEAGLEEMNQWHLQLPQDDAIDFQHVSFTTFLQIDRCRIRRSVPSRSQSAPCPGVPQNHN